jgi:hypothetical protein
MRAARIVYESDHWLLSGFHDTRHQPHAVSDTTSSAGSGGASATNMAIAFSAAAVPSANRQLNDDESGTENAKPGSSSQPASVGAAKSAGS